MDEVKNRRATVDRIFKQALDKPAAERPAFVDDACGDDPELRETVKRLLQASEETDDWLSPGGAARGPLWQGLAGTLGKTEADATEGQRIGSYQVVREIGRGGMGAVYLANRADGLFRHQVALKLLKLDTESEESRRRFDQERQILATLNHPSIARLLDGGVSAAGRPYFALEHVAGRPIDDYCDAERLSINERLRLFQTVGKAVQYAHRNLVVHRDLKPSNILVTADGEVKLLDFGIAKLLDSAAVLHAAPPTRSVMRLMTPDYASPEQVRGEPVTTATDVYQLGLLLYQLLTGLKPYQVNNLTAGELERVITQEVPPAPSVMLRRPRSGDTPTTAEAISQARSTSPERLRKRLTGDLDTIVLVALDKEPARRYPTAAALVDDVERYLAGRPITARRASGLYRLSKFVGRHRLGVATAALLVISLLAGIIGIVWNARRAAREEAKAREVKEFLVSLFKSSDPYAGDGGIELTARQILDRGAERIAGELEDEPEIKTELMTVLGRIYVELAHYDQAQPLLEQAHDSARELHGEGSEALTEVLDGLANLNWSQGRYDQAVTLYEQILTVTEARHGPEAAETAEVLSNLGILFRRQGQFERSEEILNRALRIQEQTLTAADPRIATTLDHFGSLYRAQGRHEESEASFRRSIQVLETAHGSGHPALAWGYNNLGTLFFDLRRSEEAESLFRRAIEIFERTLGPEHPSVAMAMSNLGALFDDMDRDAESEQLLLRSMEIREQSMGDSPALAWTLSNLAYLYLDQERYAEAEAFFRRATDIREHRLGPDHPAVAQSLSGLGSLHADLGRDAEAERLFKRTLKIREAALGPDHVDVAHTLQHVAKFYLERERYEEAEPLLRRALEARLKLFDADSAEVVETRAALDEAIAGAP